MKFDFSNLHILVIGDLILDRYILGKSNRLSPEAPVPVIIPVSEYSVPGGAANVSLNLSSIQVKTSCLGVVGNDFRGKELAALLKENGVNISGVIQSSNFPTTVKKRVYLNDKQVLRIDREQPLDSSNDSEIIQTIKRTMQDVDGIILSDYNKGVLNKNIISFVISLAQENNVPVIVDPKKDNFDPYKGATIITPNLKEFSQAVKIKERNEMEIIKLAKDQINKNNFQNLLITEGENGMTLVGKDFAKKIHANVVKNPDVTGAGDTVVAIFSAFFCLTGDIFFSAQIANRAASHVVSKLGTAYIALENLSEILNEF